LGDAAAERTADAWSNVSESGAGCRATKSVGEKVSPHVPVDASTFGEDDANVAEWASGNCVLVTEFDSLEPGPAATKPEIAFDEPDIAKPDQLAEQETRPESGSAAKREPVSYIERYSHLLCGR